MLLCNSGGPGEENKEHNNTVKWILGNKCYNVE